MLCYAFLQLTLALVYIANTSALPLLLRPASLAVHGFCAGFCPAAPPAQPALLLPTCHLRAAAANVTAFTLKTAASDVAKLKSIGTWEVNNTLEAPAHSWQGC